MMSHAINEGLMKFVAERNSIEKNKSDGTTKTMEDLVNELTEKSIISKACAEASMRIWKSYRNDIHHMNPTVGKIDFKKLAQQNLKHLSTIEKEIFDFKNNKGVMAPTQRNHWDIKSNGTSPVFLRLD